MRPFPGQYQPHLLTSPAPFTSLPTCPAFKSVHYPVCQSVQLPTCPTPKSVHKPTMPVHTKQWSSAVSVPSSGNVYCLQLDIKPAIPTGRLPLLDAYPTVRSQPDAGRLRLRMQHCSICTVHWCISSDVQSGAVHNNVRHLIQLRAMIRVAVFD